MRREAEAARRRGRARSGGRRSAASRGPRRARAGPDRASCAPRAIPRSTISPRDGIELEPLDLLYDQADDLDTVYAAIADRVVETARERGEIVYAVPGSPTIAERSVELVRGAGIDVEMIPGISFVDLAWSRLGIDPMHGARVVDARTFAVDAAGSSGPMLIAQCDSRLVCSEVKLALLESLPAEHEVTVLQRPRPARRAHLHRSRSPTSTARSSPTISRRCSSTPATPRSGPSSRACSRSPSASAARAGARGTRRRRITRCAATCSKRRTKSWRRSSELPPDAPGGDIPIGAYDALEDELGDLLFQVMIQSVLASEAGAFTVADVARGVHAKLVRRHPHVFGDVRGRRRRRGRDQLGADQEGREGRHVARRGHHARACPALIYAQKLFRKAASIGLATPISRRGPGRRWTKHGARRRRSAVLGRRRVPDAGLDGESALGAWAGRFRQRFERMEQLAPTPPMSTSPRPTTGDVRRLWDACSGPAEPGPHRAELDRADWTRPNVRSLPLGSARAYTFATLAPGVS